MQEAGQAKAMAAEAQMADALASCGLAVDEVFFPPASVDGIRQLAEAEEMAISTLSANINLLRCVTDALMQSRERDTAQIAELFECPAAPQPASTNQLTSAL